MQLDDDNDAAAATVADYDYDKINWMSLLMMLIILLRDPDQRKPFLLSY